MFDIDEKGNFKMAPEVFEYCEAVYDKALTEQDEKCEPNYQSYIKLMEPWFDIEATFNT